jgi:hypothetical protein
MKTEMREKRRSWLLSCLKKIKHECPDPVELRVSEFSESRWGMSLENYKICYSALLPFPFLLSSILVNVNAAIVANCVLVVITIVSLLG